MPRLNELRLQRGRLLEHITTQRYILIAEVQPVRGTLQRTDKLLATLRRATTYVQQHPLEVGLATAVLFAFNIRRTLRLLRRGFFLWRSWQMLRKPLSPLGRWRTLW